MRPPERERPRRAAADTDTLGAAHALARIRLANPEMPLEGYWVLARAELHVIERAGRLGAQIQAGQQPAVAAQGKDRNSSGGGILPRGRLTRRLSRNMLCFFGSLAGLALALAVSLVYPWGVVAHGLNDFLGFYAGARLVGTPDLYSATRVAEVQLAAAGVMGPSLRYTRMPYYAAVLRATICRFPFQTAYVLWELLAVLALAGFVALWRPPDRPLTLLFTFWCLPVFLTLLVGQELTFLLLWIALAVRLVQREQPAAAGFCLAMCASKFHLFLLVPLLVVRQKRWRMMAGAAAGAALLLAVSFVVAGPRWPLDYAKLLLDPNINPSEAIMPNLRGVFARWPGAWPLRWVVTALVGGVVWLVAGQASFEYSLAAALAGGLLVGGHAYVHDCTLLLPAALAVRSTTTVWWVKLVAEALLFPITYLFSLSQQSMMPVVVPLLILIFMAGTAWEGLRKVDSRYGE